MWSWRRGRRHLAGHRLDVGHELPDLLGGDVAAERRHPIGASLRDRRVDLIGLCALDPLVVNQGGPDRAAAVDAVAGGAVVRAVEPLAFAHAPRILLIRA